MLKLGNTNFRFANHEITDRRFIDRRKQEIITCL
jgi:hypothetical protein